MNILIVDDDKNTCEILEKFLELKGSSCTRSNDSKSALKLLQKNGLDIVPGEFGKFYKQQPHMLS